MFLAFVQLLAEGFPDFLAKYLGIIYPFAISRVQTVFVVLSVLLCATCTPIPFGTSTVYIVLATVTSVVQFVWPSMLLA